jgi:hypothetical protein
MGRESALPSRLVKEWIPAVLASSIHFGADPSLLGSLDRINWLPANVAAASMHEKNIRRVCGQ